MYQFINLYEDLNRCLEPVQKLQINYALEEESADASDTRQDSSDLTRLQQRQKIEAIVMRYCLELMNRTRNVSR